MSCGIVQWMLSGGGAPLFTHGAVGLGCVLGYAAVARWWKGIHRHLPTEQGRSSKTKPQLARRAA